jgi:hypothetical protein
MPNWCYNTAYLHNDDVTKIDALEAELQKTENCQPLNHLCPNPSGEWDYGWSVNNWGTKWDITPSDWERQHDNCIIIHFDSAWSPPTTLYEFLEQEGWSVRALYHEPGMGFIGSFEDGYDDYYDYDLTDRESIENLPEDLIDYGNLMDELERWEEENFEDQLADLERTEWYIGQEPACVGRYEVQTEAWPYPQYCNWNGKEWSRWEGDEIQVTQWRGLAEEYKEWDPVAALDALLETFEEKK